MRLVAKRPQDQHVLEPLDPASLLDRGAPLGDDARDVCAPAAVEPFGRCLAVLGDEGVDDGLDELRVRRHVVLPCGRNRSGSSRRLSPNPYRSALRPLASTPDGDPRTRYDENVPILAAANRERQQLIERHQAAGRRRPKSRRALRWQRNDGPKGSGMAGYR